MGHFVRDEQISRPSARSQESLSGNGLLAPLTATYTQDGQNSRPGTRSTTRSVRSYGYDEDVHSCDAVLRSKESKKSLFSGGMFKNRSTSNKDASTPPSMESKSMQRRGGESAFDGIYGSGDSRFGVQVSITGGNAKPKKPTFAEKAARFGREAFGVRSASTESDNRMDKSRQPGQYTAVKNMSDMSRGGSRLSNSSSGNSLVSFDHQTRDVRETVASSIYDDGETVDPVLPLNIIKRAPESQPTAPPQLPPLNHSSEVPSFTGLQLGERDQDKPEADRPIRRSTDSQDSARTVTLAGMEQTKSHFSWTTYAETERSISPVLSHREYDTMTREADSRFSWTTASTDMTYQQETPPSSPPKEYESSIMSRRRPVPGKDVVFPKRHDSLRNVKKVRGATCDKALPEPPKTKQESDHVEELMSRLESLELQKTNMQKLLKELEKVETASPIDVSERMRRENRKKMIEVRTRQDEVQREAFEVGRLLSRARAKAEEADGQGTGLWLRRVTD